MGVWDNHLEARRQKKAQVVYDGVMISLEESVENLRKLGTADLQESQKSGAIVNAIWNLHGYIFAVYNEDIVPQQPPPPKEPLPDTVGDTEETETEADEVETKKKDKEVLAGSEETAPGGNTENDSAGKEAKEELSEKEKRKPKLNKVSKTH